ncbi:hypothetical protein AAFF_G00385440 [Aldrovandia affinis]|uniref:Uncharacterized protein n=1 Tax=Aldrovandia affinis TaxID=143900 RepID=A0AAD7SFA2_9TELE|nr:hypothetical protein AAFF_G00385440 [Aldrovandia affinis]
MGFLQEAKEVRRLDVELDGSRISTASAGWALLLGSYRRQAVQATPRRPVNSLPHQAGAKACGPLPAPQRLWRAGPSPTNGMMTEFGFPPLAVPDLSSR